MIIGILGMMMIALGWIPQIIATIKTRKSSLSPGFAALYSLGSLLLLIYAVHLKDLIFSLLNLFATLMALIALAYSANTKIKKKK